jgi:signal transduction histidine kinase
MLPCSRHHPLDINTIIREFEGLIQRTVEALVEVTCVLDDELLPAMGDRVQFQVALLNIAANARDAMPLGGRLVISTRNVILNTDDASDLGTGDYIMILVRDTGEGMSRETQAKAFEPFFTPNPGSWAEPSGSKALSVREQRLRSGCLAFSPHRQPRGYPSIGSIKAPVGRRRSTGGGGF